MWALKQPLSDHSIPIRPTCGSIGGSACTGCLGCPICCAVGAAGACGVTSCISASDLERDDFKEAPLGRRIVGVVPLNAGTDCDEETCLSILFSKSLRLGMEAPNSELDGIESPLRNFTSLDLVNPLSAPFFFPTSELNQVPVQADQALHAFM